MSRGWAATVGDPTVLVLVRHGVTEHTAAKRFSGGLGGDNPGLSPDGRDQVRATAAWLPTRFAHVDALVTSPVRRTQESAEILGAALGLEPSVEPGLAEMEFGVWDGLSFAEVQERHPAELDEWLGSLDVAAGGGESFQVVQERVLAARGRLLAAHAGHTVVVVSHVTPIKVIVADALGAPLEAVFRMELSPASVTAVAVYPDARASMRLFNALPPAATS